MAMLPLIDEMELLRFQREVRTRMEATGAKYVFGRHGPDSRGRMVHVLTFETMGQHLQVTVGPLLPREIPNERSEAPKGTGTMAQLWWISVGGNRCEPARVIDGMAFTIGCPDGISVAEVEMVKEIDQRSIPLTAVASAKRAARWEAKVEADRKRGIIHGYRRFD
jgi:hypothetical protein